MSIMTTKVGTKTWADQSQKDPALDKQQTQLTEEQKKMLGAENIGDVLNKVSDGNWVDPSKKVRGTGNKEMDKDAFFKLMLTQMKNQDPTNPLKNHEMAAQLAQFSSLEQMSNMNKTLQEIKTGDKPAEQFQALNLIGKQVSGDSSKLTRSELDKEHEFKFSLPQDAQTTQVNVVNNKGETVREYKFNLLKAGENKISWNGENSEGRKMPAGDYKFEIESVGANGQKMNVKTGFEGVVSGISFSAEGPVLQVGKQSVRLGDIRQFSDPSLMSNDQNSKDITALDLKMGKTSVNTHIKEEAKTAAQKQAMSGSADDMLATVNMSGDLQQKIKQDLDGANKTTVESQTANTQEGTL